MSRQKTRRKDIYLEEAEKHEEALAKLLFRASFFILIAYTVLMSIRLSLSSMHTAGMGPLTATYVVVLATMYMSYHRIRVRIAAHFLFSSLAVLVLIRSYVAGGTDSPVLIVAILIPVAAVFLLGRLAGVIYASSIILVISIFVVMRFTGYEFPEIQLQGVILGVMQSVVVIVVMSISTWVAWLYARHNEALTSRLLDQTHRDHLTGIPNRRAFDFALVREIKLARRNKQVLSLLMVDLDYFKRFNDMYGHHEGDLCLIEVANMIQSCLRRPGDMVARYGGEEFSVILPDTNLTQAKQLAETMRHAVLGLNIEHKDSPFSVVTITSGISDLAMAHEVEPEDFLQQADEALYAGKAAGRNQVFIKENHQAELEWDRA